MNHPMLYLHWRQTRLALIPLIVGAFGLPLLANQAQALELTEYADMAAVWLPVFPTLAAAIGIILALTAWNWDHQQGHVYALALPMARREYALRKMGAGAVLALAPVAAFWVGAHLAAASVTVPEGMNAYPNHLALRFLIAVLLAYSVLFAMSAGTIKTTIWVVTGVIGFFVAGGLLNELLAQFFPIFEQTSIVEIFGDALLDDWGPLGVLTGNWRLIDV